MYLTFSNYIFCPQSVCVNLRITKKEDGIQKLSLQAFSFVCIFVSLFQNVVSLGKKHSLLQFMNNFFKKILYITSYNLNLYSVSSKTLFNSEERRRFNFNFDFLKRYKVQSCSWSDMYRRNKL